MNWHVTDIPTKYGSGWTGYTWNKKLFPEPEKLLATLHAQGKHVTLNVHPAAGIRPSEVQYPEVAKAVGIDPASKQPVLFDLTIENLFKPILTWFIIRLKNRGLISGGLIGSRVLHDHVRRLIHYGRLTCCIFWIR